MQLEEGVVIEAVIADSVRIRVGRHEECSGCGACGAVRQAVVVAQDGGYSLQPGMRVRFAMPEHSVVLGAFVVFMLPLVLAAVGGLLGWLALWSDVAVVCGAVVGALLGMMLVRLFDRRAQRRQPYVVEILGRTGDQ